MRWRPCGASARGNRLFYWHDGGADQANDLRKMANPTSTANYNSHLRAGGGSGRGLFIVLEGVDRAGKSTQVKRVVQHLESRGWPALAMAFPDRCTGVGMLIDDYLRNHRTMSRQCLHLLFSANRWEQEHVLESFINSGTTIVCDRFAYSGAAYSHGAEDLDFDWCLRADNGLIRPDIVYQLGVEPQDCLHRGNFGKKKKKKETCAGAEIYERLEIAERVAQAYNLFHQSDNWVYISPPPPDAPADDDAAVEENQTNSPIRRKSTIQYVTREIQKHLDQFLSSIPQDRGTTTLPLRRLGDGDPW